MAIIRALGSISDLDVNTGFSVSSTSGQLDLNVAKEGIFTASSFMARISITPTSDFWFNTWLYQSNLSSSSILTPIQFYDTTFSTTQALFRLQKTVLGAGVDGGIIGQYWNGSAWVSVGTGVLWEGFLYEQALRIKMHATLGVFGRYHNTVLDGQLSGNTILTAGTAINRIEIALGIGQTTFSEIIIADEDTRGMRLQRCEPTSNGANTAWTGVFSDVDETGITDSDLISSASANQIETYGCGDIHSSMSAFAVKAVAVSARARKGGTGPQNLQAATRIGATNYFTSNLSALNTAFAAVQGIWAVSPATGIAWTQAEVNAAEFGLKSIA